MPLEAIRRGKRGPDREAYWHGSQPGVVSLAERKLRVRKRRLRKKGAGAGGELEVPAYEAMRGGRLGERMLEILLSGVSTRRYKDVLPQMADAVGISKSEVSRQTIEAGERVLQDLAERRFDDKEILIVYIDGVQFGSHHIVAAINGVWLIERFLVSEEKVKLLTELGYLPERYYAGDRITVVLMASNLLLHLAVFATLFALVYSQRRDTG